MKRISFAMVIFMIFAFAGVILAHNYPGDYAGAKADYLYKKLNLTTEQYTKIYQIYLDAHSKLDAMNMNKMEKDAKKKAMSELMDKTNAEIQKVFTKEQLEKWPKIKNKVCKVKPRKMVKKTTDTTETKEEPKKEEKKDDKKK